MTSNQMIHKNALRIVAGFVLASSFPLLSFAQAASGQKTFPTASAAAAALIAACHSNDEAAMLAILGPDGKDLISSGDPVADQKARASFVKSYTTKHSLKSEGQGYDRLIIGADDYPTAIPIVRDGESWYFDSAKGRDEIINRRVGQNELGAIAVCEGYVEAQKEYAARGHDGGPAGIYAQRLVSTEGKHDGLYWPQVAGKPMSPMGPAIAEAAAEGYTGSGSANPYHGYFYKLLKEQGPDAPGGAKSYLVDGKLSGGFALLAYPAEYGNSGIMTFIVNQDGSILQKDLGDDTVNAAKAITAYNPDNTWASATDN